MHVLVFLTLVILGACVIAGIGCAISEWTR
jgi:hypothetical protein